MRLRNDPYAMEKLKESKLLVDTFPFKLKTNDVIELGAGKGEMICELAKNNPNIRYIAIEKYPTVASKIAKKALDYNLNNLFIICEDIEKINEFLIGSVSLIWITFSDPWPKKRHFKRRLTYKDFLEKYKKILNENGIIKFKTDNDFLFQFSIESLNEFGANIIFKTSDLHNSIKNKNNIMTGYEQKWSSEGKNINYIEFNFNK
ncbi:tRNA (guanosine(46)-N7)-methyltransferase TrmB [Mycoplasma phocimorsus]|uniref:tRNA (guanine-N(7)-)-methyltransferase n=1 Tax=Mycoplasma phocimorsus TaxID=3045839 RepID=A0AAJ1PUG5_9MOLU|nr:tRNA (guanosine(46)-N7)-methyltransferase TrmB [Mycoplasma phocimorsus]MDJ1646041.1 tRNA (guanosine(46)-N7)-methyltransferase TrmB [Mycoplasma phocimorsus]MDJ1646345.1 tRNA (guanosine(46)-N7)-methyltransferase TrmB [Mycoplasma phocimorsus]MDJ1647090.1 tRNA (guanosine(46)-N7)-methyltransferase TrmB [Mycoplasma phocimorsus]MDJ1647530.1 tRNA (guanosine(46)-N7)-methyltransferase TrmB [Mycoplasma phocimorsus]MDJ1648148.1 tRNA (guanosine(46)-N7)-methyltransferase TrmB [Mycoplasma phocimorsus]